MKTVNWFCLTRTQDPDKRGLGDKMKVQKTLEEKLRIFIKQVKNRLRMEQLELIIETILKTLIKAKNVEEEKNKTTVNRHMRKEMT